MKEEFLKLTCEACKQVLLDDYQKPNSKVFIIFGQNNTHALRYLKNRQLFNEFDQPTTYTFNQQHERFFCPECFIKGIKEEVEKIEIRIFNNELDKLPNEDKTTTNF